VLKKLFRRGVALLALLAVLCGGGVLYVKVKASNLDLPALHRGQVSVVYASNGKTILGRIAAAGVTEHSQLKDDQVSPLIRQAHMAAEDRTFYEHGAVSLLGTARAFYANATSGTIVAGGSTITQQYVKNAYLTQEQTLERKKNEVIYSYRVEQDFTKDQILTKYVNSNYYGRGAYGIEDAARVWFGVSAKKLSDLNDPLQVARAAFLAALLKQPSYYALYRKGHQPSDLINLGELVERQRYVLDGFRQVRGVAQQVPQDVVDKAKALLPLKLTNTVKPSGKTTDGDPYIISYVRDWLTAWQTQVALSDGLGEDAATKQGNSMAEAMLARGGLQIVTSLDATAQKQLAFSARYNAPGNGLAHGAVIMNPQTGGVVAMHSGSSRGDEAYNYALYANREVGSIMKTVVLADAVRSGISPNSVLPAPAYIKVNGSRIYNDDHRAAPGCKLSLAEAMAKSNNPVHVELITGKMASCQNPGELRDIESNYPVSPKSVANLARQMGADDSLVPGRSNPAKLPEVPSLALGVGSMTPVKVAAIGSTFANGGTHVSPYLMDHIIAIDGKVVYQHQSSQTKVLGEREAAVVNQTLTGVFAPGGTGENVRVEGHPTAGKTGTTSTDAWGLMYSAVSDNSPAYVCAAWAGYPEHRQTADDLWGSTVLRLCRGFLRQALKDEPSVGFSMTDMSEGRHIGLQETVEHAPAPEPTPSAEETTESPTPEAPPTEIVEPSPSVTEEPSPSPSPSTEDPQGTVSPSDSVTPQEPEAETVPEEVPEE